MTQDELLAMQYRVSGNALDATANLIETRRAPSHLFDGADENTLAAVVTYLRESAAAMRRAGTDAETGNLPG